VAPLKELRRTTHVHARTAGREAQNDPKIPENGRFWPKTAKNGEKPAKVESGVFAAILVLGNATERFFLEVGPVREQCDDLFIFCDSIFLTFWPVGTRPGPIFDPKHVPVAYFSQKRPKRDFTPFHPDFAQKK
jgi:hypothetical protein